MKLVKIKHYVEKSYSNRPSFILEMSNSIDYISNGCIFEPVNKLDELIDEYKIPQKRIDELFSSPSIDISELVNSRHMFYGSDITEFEFDMPNLVYGNLMFNDCKKLEKFKSNMPSLVYGNYMFYNCLKLEKFISDMPSLNHNTFIFIGCKNLNKKSLENIKKIKL